MNWLLNLIGIMIYFINRYAKRTKRTIAFSFKFWLRDNWAELVPVLLLNLALMIIIHLPDSAELIEKAFAKLPEWVSILGIPGVCFGLGLGLSSLFYEIFKKKVKDAKNNP
jgi:hypothetical protein